MSEDVKIKKSVKSEKETKKKVRKVRRQRRLKDKIINKLIPLHTIADEKDLEELKIKDISLDKLPLISVSDSAIRHLEVSPGDVIKIKRENEIIGDVYYFRRVIKDD